MKTTILAVLTSALLGASAQAGLIDLTPGGFDETQPFPTVVQHFFGQYAHGVTNLAGASIVNGQPVWSPFTLFGDDHFDLTLNPAGTGAEVGWDLIGTGFRGLFVFVESSALVANLYAVPSGQRFNGIGFGEINGTIPISGVTFVGTNRGVPDTGSTLALMSFGLLGLLFYEKTRSKANT